MTDVKTESLLIMMELAARIDDQARELKALISKIMEGVKDA